MKKIILALCVFSFLLIQKSFSQTAAAPSPLEREITDSVCNCMANVDLSKITTKEEATAVITDCFSKRTDLLMKLADEKHIDPTDNPAMRQLGIQIGKNLLVQNCAAFTKLSVKMVQNKAKEEEGQGYNEGKFKRIDTKGFNYIVITDKSGSEKSFIWFRQFSGSEKFTNGGATYIGKNVKIKYQELEVYLPQARGYYKVKEIVELTIQ